VEAKLRALIGRGVNRLDAIAGSGRRFEVLHENVWHALEVAVERDQDQAVLGS
jgi:hypothetical protein